MSVTVGFLARGQGAGLAALEGFLASHAAHPAGAPHRLVLMVKGWDGVPGRTELDRLARDAGAEILELPDDGFDWGAYFRLAEVAETEFLFLLNSHSRILRDNWLAILLAEAARPGVGIVGCTGNWGSIAPSWRTLRLHILDRWRAREWTRLAAVALVAPLRDIPRWLRHRRRFKSFPNPHLRSNGFLIRTRLLRDFARRHTLPTTKTDAYALESGRSGLTRFVSDLGLATRVCGADGRAFDPADWPQSGTFCTPGQPQLLVADNQTRAYDEAPARHRRALEANFWGQFLTPRAPGA